MVHRAVQDFKREVAEAQAEDRIMKEINCFLQDDGTDGQPLCGVWKADESGWTKVEVVMDSGAAESVCPRNMCPQYPIKDSVASLIDSRKSVTLSLTTLRAVR